MHQSCDFRNWPKFLFFAFSISFASERTTGPDKIVMKQPAVTLLGDDLDQGCVQGG